MNLLIGTNRSLISTGILLLRCTAGLILFVAGAGKLFGWFMPLDTVLGFYNQMGFNNFWAYTSIYTELIGGLLFIPGLFTRPAALAITINMLVAVITHGTKDFFTGGEAYPLLLMITALAILLTGPMNFSLDALFWRRPYRQV